MHLKLEELGIRALVEMKGLVGHHLWEESRYHKSRLNLRTKNLPVRATAKGFNKIRKQNVRYQPLSNNVR